MNFCILFHFCCDSVSEANVAELNVDPGVNSFCFELVWETTKVSIMISYRALPQWKVGVSHILNLASHARPNSQNLELPKSYK